MYADTAARAARLGYARAGEWVSRSDRRGSRAALVSDSLENGPYPPTTISLRFRGLL